MRRRAATKGTGSRFGFINDTVSELKKVVWPSRREATNLTTIVIIFSVVMGLILGLMDYIYAWLINGLLLGGG